MDADGQLNQSSDVVFDSVQGPSGSSLIVFFKPLPPSLSHPTGLLCLCVAKQCTAIAILADAVWVQSGNVLISNTAVTGTVHLAEQLVLFLHQSLTTLCFLSIFPAQRHWWTWRAAFGSNTATRRSLRRMGSRVQRARSLSLPPSLPLSFRPQHVKFIVLGLPARVCRSQVRSRLFLEPVVSAWD